VHVAPGRRIPAALPARLAAWCAGFAGAWLEDKGLCFTLHFRAVPARRRRAFVAGARRLLAAHRGRVEVLPGKRVLEVRPAGRADKAAALARWLARRRRTAVIYVGDDLIDEPAHVLARRRDGIAVAVGRTRSRAEYGLRTPAGVAWFLEWLARAWSRRHAPGPTPGPRSGFPRPRPPDAI
jgi:trehalose-phosphatase